MAIEYVLHERQGVYINEHTPSDFQDVAGRLLADYRRKRSDFHDYLESAPNLNGKYGEELEFVEDYFSEDGYGSAPISILAEPEYALALSLTGDNRELGGAFVMGRIIIKENPEAVAIFGSSAILGTALHERAHASIEEGDPIVVGKVVEGETNLICNVRVCINSKGSEKYSASQDVPVIEGEFLEEGFADLTRARALRGSERQPRLTRGFTDDNGIYYTPENWQQDSTERLTIPGSFLSVLKEHECGSTSISSISAVPAYALDLLDQVSPGLYDLMKTSRREPAKYREVIKAINNIRPGLYGDLRRLHYTPGDFKQGLQIVKAAIR